MPCALGPFLLLLPTAAPPAQQPPVPPPGGQDPVVRFASAEEDVDVTLGATLRWRWEARLDYDFDRSGGRSDDFVEQRSRIWGDFRVDGGLRAFVQIQDARTWGEEESTTDRSAEGLDLHQGYLDWQLQPGTTLRVGRQEAGFGEERLVGRLDWATQARSFNGLRLDTAVMDPTDVLSGFLFQTRKDPFQPASGDQLFSGLYLTMLGSMGESDLYLLYLHQDRGPTLDPPREKERRFTFGTRQRTRLWEFDGGVEAALQYGRMGRARIPLWKTAAAAADVGWTFPAGEELKPRVAIEAEYATGDNPRTSRRERFNTLFPTSHAHLGAMDFAFWENVLRWGGSLSAELGGARTTLRWLHLRSVQPADAFRGPNNELSPGVAGGSRTMGDELNLVVDGKAAGRVDLQAGYGVFFPGRGVRQALGSDDPAHFVYFMMGIRI